MEDQIRVSLKGNDHAIEKAIKGVRERAAAYKDQRKEEANALEAGVNGLILGGKSTGDVRKSPEFIRLAAQDPESARKIDAYLENRDYTRVARAAAQESRAAAVEQRKDAAESRAQRAKHNEGFDTALRLSDPDALMAMSRDQVVNLLPTLGNTHTAALVQRWDTFSKNEGALSEAKLDNVSFKNFARNAGLDINPKPNDTAAKERLVDLNDKINAVLSAEQVAKGKKLTRQERDDIIQKQTDDQVMVWRLFKDPKLSVIAVDDKDLKNAYVEVAGKTVYLHTIPAAFRKSAMEARKAEGLHTTEAQLAELWLRKNGKLK
jgi:hypothetical protein